MASHSRMMTGGKSFPWFRAGLANIYTRFEASLLKVMTVSIAHNSIAQGLEYDNVYNGIGFTALYQSFMVNQ